jgi:hypothetical protein
MVFVDRGSDRLELQGTYQMEAEQKRSKCGDEK